MRIFGFEIRKPEDEQDISKQPMSFVEPTNEDGAITVGNSNALGGFYGMMLDMEGAAKTESELVTKYRSMAMQTEITQAVDEIVNEAISIDSHEKVVEVVLDDTKLPDKVKEKITEEFDSVLSLLDFSNNAYDIFSRFYVDGRLNYHIMIDNENLKDGIYELRYIDPRKLRLVKEIDKREKDPHSGIPIKRVKSEYYMYSEGGFGSTKGSQMDGTTQGYRIAKDSIARITSGILNENNSMVLGHLHPAIKPLNQLRMLEDAVVIYTLTRAPERRIFYIDVGNLPKAKAEQYLHDMMVRHKNKLTYDSTSGDITDSRRFMTMTEDFWFPRRGGDRSTEVDLLAGGNSQALSSDENLQYFQRQLYKSLRVPISRLEPETMYTFGRVSEISRDELKFSKFIRRIRTRFSQLFDVLLEKQLILKGILDPEEWKEIQNKIRYDFMKDNYFEELKSAEIQREKMSTLREVEEQIGKYFSREWVVKNVLFMTDAEWKEMEKQIKNEREAEEQEMKNEPPGPEQDTEESLLINSQNNTNNQIRSTRE